MAAAMGAAAAMSTSISSSSSSMLSTASSSSSFIGDPKSLLLLRPSVNLSNARRAKGRGGIAVVEAKIREIFMPALSSTMTEGKIVSWSKSEGDKLSKGESVVVVESDKADMDVETFYDGYLASIMVGEGEVAPVGAAIALLAETEDEIADARSKAAASSSALSSPAEAAPEPVVATSSSPSEVPSAAVVAAPVAMPSVAIDGEKPEKRPVTATPYAKKLAKQYKLDLANVAGTGPYGRIVASDVESAAGKPVTTTGVPSLQAVAASILVAPKAEKQLDGALAAAASAAPVSASGGAAAAAPRADSVVPFTGMQVAVAKNMVESLSVPTFRVGYTITTTALDALYKKIKSKGVTMSALLAKATALALAQHPVVNASCKDGKSFSYNSSINIAVAVATDGGLITPVLQDADKIDIYSLSRKWKELVDKARAKQLQPQEYSTGTFTISNLGMFGVDRFDAILPPGQGAIMAIGASKPSVVATGAGLFSVKNQMQVNVTADHRIVYGADLAGFLQTLSKIIEDPKDLTL